MGLSLHCVSSGLRTKDALIMSGVSYLVAVTVIPPAEGLDCTVEILDSTTSTGTTLALVVADDEVDIISSKHFCPALPIKAVNGLYLKGISAQGGEKVIVHCFSKDGNPIVAEPA